MANIGGVYLTGEHTFTGYESSRYQLEGNPRPQRYQILATCCCVLNATLRTWTYSNRASTCERKVSRCLCLGNCKVRLTIVKVSSLGVLTVKLDAATRSGHYFSVHLTFISTLLAPVVRKAILTRCSSKLSIRVVVRRHGLRRLVITEGIGSWFEKEARKFGGEVGLS